MEVKPANLLSNVLIVLALSQGLAGCWVKKTACRGLHNALPDGTCSAYDGGAPAAAAGAVDGAVDGAIGGVAGGTGTAAGTSAAAAPGYALARIVPEQLSNDLAQAVNFGADAGELRHFEPAIGQTLDYLTIGFGVPLGGIDFVTSQRRDPDTKAQTLLVARVVAWQIAGAALWKDHDKAASARVLFTKCRMETDRPYQPSDAVRPALEQALVKEGEARWLAQVEELFFRLYARPPADAEVAAVKAAFLATFNNEGYAPAGWLTVLYALLASQEFWHR